MGKIRGLVVVVKCSHCGHETSKMVPLEISEEDWRLTQKKYGEELITYQLE